MPIGAYKTEWQQGDPIGKSWLRKTSRWLAGMSSPDGSLYISHNENGIAITANQTTSSAATSTGATYNFLQTSVDLMPTMQIASGYLQVRTKRVRLNVSGNTISIAAAATYGDWVSAVRAGCTP